MSRLIKNLKFLIADRQDTVKGASRAAGLGETTIRDILNQPGKSSRIDTLQKLAAYFGVSTDDLMGLDLSRVSPRVRAARAGGVPATTAEANDLQEEFSHFESGIPEYGVHPPRYSPKTGPSGHKKAESIRELDISAQGGSGTMVEEENIVREWGIPADYLSVFTRSHADNLFIIGVVGDSMAPDFPPGQRVLVDVSDKMPSPEGVFVIYDGFGLMIKRCQMIPHSNPPVVRLISANKEYPVSELELTDEMIKGRVIGAWKWS